MKHRHICPRTTTPIHNNNCLLICAQDRVRTIWTPWSSLSRHRHQNIFAYTMRVPSSVNKLCVCILKPCVCRPAPHFPSPHAECGDGVRSGTELCDDSNAISGDGCSNTCHVECGFNCTLVSNVADVCTSRCGDSTRASNEACDDGNLGDSDGCSSSCVTEAGWITNGGSDHCTLSAASKCAANSAPDLAKAVCLCNTGYTGNAVNCWQCGAGTYKNTLGTGACIACDAISISPTGSTVLADCIACASNSGPNNEKTNCLCNMGYTATAGGCSACAAGKYKPTRGSGLCNDCDAGFISPAGSTVVGACTACGLNSTRVRAYVQACSRVRVRTHV